MKIIKLEYTDLPFTHDSIHGSMWPSKLKGSLELSFNYDKDKNGIPIFISRNHNFDIFQTFGEKLKRFFNQYIDPGTTFYHPNRIALNTLPLLDGYIVTENQDYLNLAIRFSNKILGLSEEINDALYFRNNHRKPMHGKKNEVMEPPWYSGMYQGVILSVFVRLFNITQKKKYLEISDKIFNCFKNIKGEKYPWVVYRDEDDFLWIEEFPMENPDNTLNGFIFAIYGLYDYFLLKRTKESRYILEEAIKTIKHNIKKFRNRGNISYYCLKHKEMSPGYHRLHIQQLYQLYKITDDEIFNKMAIIFYEDFY